MAIVRVSSASSFENDVAAFLTISHTIAAGDDRLMVSSVGIQSGQPTVSWDYDSVGLTQDVEEDDPSGPANDMIVASLVAPNVGTADLTYTKGNSTGFIALCVANYTGAKQSGQPDAIATATTASGTGLSYTLTTVVDDCWIMSGMSNLSGAAVVDGSNWVALEVPSTTNGQFADSNGSVGAAGGKTVAMTGSSTRWWGASASYAPAIAASGIAASRRMIIFS